MCDGSPAQAADGLQRARGAADAAGMRANLCDGAHPGVLLLLATLAACGGGGGGGDDVPVAPAPPGASDPAPETVAGTSPVSEPSVAGTRATCGLANFQSELLALVNQHRTAGATCGDRGSFPAVGTLAWSDALTSASLMHSDDMVAANFFAHTGSDGRSAGQRITAAGYVWRTWGENIAAGQPTVARVMADWMKSPGHCANLMNANFRDIGVACVAGSSGTTYRTYWTQNFGALR